MSGDDLEAWPPQSIGGWVLIESRPVRQGRDAGRAAGTFERPCATCCTLFRIRACSARSALLHLRHCPQHRLGTAEVAERMHAAWRKHSAEGAS